MHRTAPGPPPRIHRGWQDPRSPHGTMDDDDEMLARVQLGQYDRGGQPPPEQNGAERDMRERESAREPVRETVGEADASDNERERDHRSQMLEGVDGQLKPEEGNDADTRM